MTSPPAWWLRPDYDRWIVTAGSGVSLDGRRDPLGIQAQSAFAHAARRLRDDADYFDRVDGILALKRAMRARLDHLNDSLNLDKLPVSCTGGRLEKLEVLGIIRRGMLQRMNKLRNAVEHDGAKPPDVAECRDYLESVWYYLKVTTPYLMPPDNSDLSLIEVIDGKAYESKVSLTYRITYRPLCIELDVQVYEDMLSPTPIEGWLKMTPLPLQWIQNSNATAPIHKEDLCFLRGRLDVDSDKVSFLRGIFAEFL